MDPGVPEGGDHTFHELIFGKVGEPLTDLDDSEGRGDCAPRPGKKHEKRR